MSGQWCFGDNYLLGELEGFDVPAGFEVSEELEVSEGFEVFELVLELLVVVVEVDLAEDLLSVR